MATKVEATNASNAVALPAGQRLHCPRCGSEIEIINPCPCNPPDQVMRCCGKDMVPTSTGNVHLGDE
jgi:hypothetical protein